MATITKAQLKAAHPEFEGAPDAVLDPAVQFANSSTPARSFGTGDLQTEAAILLAAQQIALSPQGRTLQLLNKDGSTIYDKRLTLLRRRAALRVGRAF